MHKVISKQATGQVMLTVFVCIWTIGLSLGLFCGSLDSANFSSSLHSASSARLSGGIIFAVLPTLLCILLWYLDLRLLILPLSFLKAFLDGFVLYASSYAFGSALWLLYWPLFFTERCMNVLFLLVAALVLLNEGKGRTLLPMSIISTIFIVGLDLFLVSPWLHKLMLKI